MIGIYKITNLINGKSYIGQSVHIERRWTEHCLPSTKSLIANAIHKYGKENFSFQVLEECLQEHLDEREEYYITHFNTIVPNGYNIMDWIDGRVTYFSIDKEVLNNIFSDIKSSELTFDEIGEKYDLSRRTIIRINQGHTHFSNKNDYPLRKKPETPVSNCCVDCGIEISKGASRCKICHDKYQRQVDRPSREELKVLVRNNSFTSIGKQYGVSDNAVRNWCKQYNIPSKASEIKKIDDSKWKEI